MTKLPFIFTLLVTNTHAKLQIQTQTKTSPPSSACSQTALKLAEKNHVQLSQLDEIFEDLVVHCDGFQMFKHTKWHSGQQFNKEKRSFSLLEKNNENVKISLSKDCQQTARELAGLERNMQKKSTKSMGELYLTLLNQCVGVPKHNQNSLKRVILILF